MLKRSQAGSVPQIHRIPQTIKQQRRRETQRSAPYLTTQLIADTATAWLIEQACGKTKFFEGDGL
jgi:hypothetical protein